ncbi:flavin reductase family protein [Mesobacillus harenae]|uniref:flavin reductase family protein n=1 Tax=Mesobacillus harenae TaxID=2213203 RepID=UPI0015802B19|nr:flavin reductase family protein [Mesobacillus harenae]
MLAIDPSGNSERENYKLMIGSIIPRPIGFVTTETQSGVLNGAPFSYFNIVSSNPPMISLSIQRNNGMRKDTARNIIDRKEFVVHMVDEQNVTKINATSASLPSEQSEVEWAGLTPIESKSIGVQGIRESKIRMECVLETALELGGQEVPSTDLIIGKVVYFHVSQELYENGKIDHNSLNAVSRLAGNYYGKIGEVFEIERPK